MCDGVCCCAISCVCVRCMFTACAAALCALAGIGVGNMLECTRWRGMDVRAVGGGGVVMGALDASSSSASETSTSLTSGVYIHTPRSLVHIHTHTYLRDNTYLKNKRYICI